MGRNDWNGEQFAIMLGEFEEVYEVYLYRSSNGGLFGDGHGKYVDNTGKGDKTYFSPGEFIYFYGNFVKNEDEFKICKYYIYLLIFLEIQISYFHS